MRFVQRLQCYDPRALAFFAAAYFGLKGAAGGMLRMALLPLFKQVARVSSVEFQAYAIVVASPWAMKPLFGMADYFPLFGRRKQWYVLIISVVGAGAATALAYTCKTAHPRTLAVLATIVSLQVATVDILSEGRYAELMTETPRGKGAIVTYVWLLTACAEVLVACVAGPVADDGNVCLLLWAIVPLSAQLIGPVLSGWMMDPIIAVRKAIDVWTARLAITIVVATGVVSWAAVRASWQGQIAVAVSTVLCLVVAALWFAPSDIAWTLVYTFLASASSLSFSGSLDYFYTSDAHCVPGGPAFTLTFYLTVATVSSAACAVVGVVLFETYLSSVQYAPLFRLATVLRVLVSLVDIMIVLRWNNAVGITDASAYLFGDACLGTVISMIGSMAMVILTVRVCPPKTECIVYALIAGSQNLGAAIAALIGNAVSVAANIRLDDTACTYDNLPLLLFLGTVVAPICVLPLTWCIKFPHNTLADDDENDDDDDQEDQLE